MKFDESSAPAPPAPPTPEWTKTNFDYPSTQNQSTHDVQIAANGEILLPAVVDCDGCVFAGDNVGQAKVYRLDGSGTVVASCELGTVTAYDLKVRVAPTADGGFGVVSSKQFSYPPDYNCDSFPHNMDTRHWNTDAFVAKCDACGNVEWQTTFDVDNVPPAPFPGDLRKQECVYSISVGDDGGFVVSGNNSYNFDDSYMAKLDPVPSSSECCRLPCGAGFCPTDTIARPLATVCNFSGADHDYDYSTSGLPANFSHELTCGIPTVDGPNYSLVPQTFGTVLQSSCSRRQVNLARPPVLASGDLASYEMQVFRSSAGGPAVDCFGSAGTAPFASCPAIPVPTNDTFACAVGKLNCTAKSMQGTLTCDYKALKRGSVVDATCLQKVRDTYDGGVAPVKGCFAKLEGKYGDACFTRGDSAAIASHVDRFVDDVVTALDPSFPTPVQNGCAAAKEKCVVKKATAILKCHAKAAKTGAAVDAGCLAKARTKFDGGTSPARSCFAKAEAKGSCLTSGDTAALEDRVDQFTTTVTCNLGDAGPACLAPTPTATPLPTATATP